MKIMISLGTVYNSITCCVMTPVNGYRNLRTRLLAVVSKSHDSNYPSLSLKGDLSIRFQRYQLAFLNVIPIDLMCI